MLRIKNATVAATIVATGTLQGCKWPQNLASPYPRRAARIFLYLEFLEKVIKFLLAFRGQTALDNKVIIGFKV
jgi:hypothetical protein